MITFTQWRNSHILWNKKVKYQLYKWLPVSSILSQLNPMKALPNFCWRSVLAWFSHLRSGLPNVPFTSGVPTKLYICSSYRPCVLYARLCLPSWGDYVIWFGIQIVKDSHSSVSCILLWIPTSYKKIQNIPHTPSIFKKNVILHEVPAHGSISVNGNK